MKKPCRNLLLKFSIILIVLIPLNLSATAFDDIKPVAEGEKVVQNNPGSVSLTNPSLGQPGAQQLTVRGTVTNENGEPFPGVNILIEGTSVGTFTDKDGEYSLDKPNENAVLVFSFVGYNPQKVSVSGKTIIDIIMIPATIGLDEIVVIGYGTTSRRSLTGSVSSVQSAALSNIPVSSAADVLVGKAAGVLVTRTEGDPDAEIKIRIRGGGSISQDNSPLYLVDGFPVDNLSGIAPTDIASIDILKDASTTAIYGARGANGVVLVTTKKGSVGKGKVNYNTYYGVKKATKRLDVMDPYHYVLWQREVEGADQAKIFFGDFRDYDLYKETQGTNWQEKCLPGGFSQYNNFSFSGGTQSTKYLVSLTRNNEKEIMINSNYVRTNLIANLTQHVNNWLTIDLNTSLSDYSLNGNSVSATGVQGRMSSIIQYKPVEGMKENIDPDIADQDQYGTYHHYSTNPMDNLNDEYREKNEVTFRFNGSARLKLSKSLTYQFQFGKSYRPGSEYLFYGQNTYWFRAVDGAPRSYSTTSSFESYRLVNTLTYSKINFLQGNNLTFMVGQEMDHSKYKSTIQLVRFLPVDIDPVNAFNLLSLGETQPIVTVNNPYARIASFFTRINYDYRKKYVISATLRADGSNKFAPGNQWGYFPSFGLSWVASEEEFMAATRTWLNDLKLRYSHGAAGNNRVGDFAFMKIFNLSSGTLHINETGVPTPFIVQDPILGNEKLTWETTFTNNIGLDFSLFKSRLIGVVDLYQNITKDLLIRYTLPASSGYTYQWKNIGQTSNKGIELMLNGIIIEKEDFQLTASFNIAFNKNRIDKLGDIKSWVENSDWGGAYGGAVNDFLIEEGGEIGQFYGYITEGMYSFDDFSYNPATQAYTLNEGVASSKALLNAPRFGPGSLKLKDVNNDGGVINDDDKVVLGSVQPKHIGGFSLTAGYKGFDLSAFFNWSYGNEVYNASKLMWSSYYGSFKYRNMLKFNETRFTWINPETGNTVSDPNELAELNKDATIWSSYNIFAHLHSWAIEDGSFLRLNTLTIGYNLPKELLNKIHLEKLRVYATTYNLWTWTNYSGFDPEVDTRRISPLTPGVDHNAYPRSRSFNIGLNVEF